MKFETMLRFRWLADWIRIAFGDIIANKMIDFLDFKLSHLYTKSEQVNWKPKTKRAKYNVNSYKK